MPAPLDILYQDDTLVVVYKPAGVLVHKSALDRYAPRILMTELRDQLGRWVYPVHRLDRPTEGVMVFTFDSDSARRVSEYFSQRQVHKRYLAIVRGHGPEQACIERPLREEDGMRPKAECPAMEAITHVRRLAEVELPVAIDRYPTSRYSLMDIRPVTGRRHQIRRHLSVEGYPIIGDAKHGKSTHNRYFKAHFFAAHEGDARLLLASVALDLPHPTLGQRLHVTASLSDDFSTLMTTLGWEAHLPVHTVHLRD